jgi:hypothetical protein
LTDFNGKDAIVYDQNNKEVATFHGEISGELVHVWKHMAEWKVAQFEKTNIEFYELQL